MNAIPRDAWLRLATSILTVLVGVTPLALFTRELYRTGFAAAERFNGNLFSGTHLANERDALRYLTTFTHGGVVEKAQHHVGVPALGGTRSSGRDERPTMPLEVLYYTHHDATDPTAVQVLPVMPITDRMFTFGIQECTAIPVVDLSPTRDAWLLGEIADIGGVLRRIVALRQDEILVESMLDAAALPRYMQVRQRVPRIAYPRKLGIPLTALSDTLFWQNGIWIHDDRAMIATANPRGARIGDTLEFEDGTRRAISFVRSNGIIELDGPRLVPFRHGWNTKVHLVQQPRQASHRKEVIDIRVMGGLDGGSLPTSGQRVLVPAETAARIAVGDHVMFADAIPRRITHVGPGYIDLDLVFRTREDSLDMLKSLQGGSADLRRILLSIQKRIEDPGIDNGIMTLPPVRPDFALRHAGGGNFLHIPRAVARFGKGNPQLAAAARRALAPGPQLDKPPHIWATYTGIVNVLYGTVHPIHRNYLIHVLGADERRQYVKSFSEHQPEYVQTSSDNSDMSNFHSWSLNTSWEFYERVLANYEPVFGHDYMVLWKRRGTEWREPDGRGFEVGTGFPVMIPPDVPGIGRGATDHGELEVLTVLVEYAVTNPWKSVPIFGKTDRFLVVAEGVLNQLPVPLPPEETAWRFPVVRRRGSPVTLRLEEVHPIATLANINVTRISVEACRASADATRNLFIPLAYGHPEIVRSLPAPNVEP